VLLLRTAFFLQLSDGWQNRLYTAVSDDKTTIQSSENTRPHGLSEYQLITQADAQNVIDEAKQN
jgi:hypothetical protein